MDNTYEAEYCRRQAARAKQRRRILFALLALLLLAVLIYSVFFVRRPLAAEDIALELRLEDGVYAVYADWTTMGGHQSGEVMLPPLRLDFDRDIDYRGYRFTLSASLWERLVHGGTSRLYHPEFYPDGRVVGVESEYSHVDPEGVRHTMAQRYGRVYYVNPDGSEVLLWACEAMPE